MTSPLEGLPEAFLALMPEVSFGPEPLATCGDCAMKPRPGVPEAQWAPVFAATARCCTYHPYLPGYAVGRALRRGGLGAERIRARLVDPEGVSAGGIRNQRRPDNIVARFGQDNALQCPFWSADAVEGQGCTLHLDREAVCRTWHCRIGTGGRGHRAWMALKELLICIEMTLSAECKPGTPPADGASVAAWEAWFLWCADRVDALGPEDVARLRGPHLTRLVAALDAAVAERDNPLPAIVIPTVQSWGVHANGVTLTAWSGYDPIEAPAWIFRFLARLDGQTSWRQAKAATEAELGHPVGDDLVLVLFQRGLIGPPEHVDVKPGLTVLPTR